MGAHAELAAGCGPEHLPQADRGGDDGHGSLRPVDHDGCDVVHAALQRVARVVQVGLREFGREVGSPARCPAPPPSQCHRPTKPGSRPERRRPSGRKPPSEGRTTHGQVKFVGHDQCFRAGRFLQGPQSIGPASPKL